MADPPPENEERPSVVSEADSVPPQPAHSPPSLDNNNLTAGPPHAAHAPLDKASCYPPWQQQHQQQALPPPHQAVAMAQYYEARMRDHAVAYANAAAGAAWAAAQIAASNSLPPTLPPTPQFGYYYSPLRQIWHPPPIAEDYNRPGKRQQTMPAGAAATAAALWQPPSSQPPPHRKEDYGSRSSAKRGRQRMRDSNNTTSSDSGRHQHQCKRFSDRTLLGKTGVSALHEWCDKRKLTPKFSTKEEESGDGFTTQVEINAVQKGSGRGATKTSSRQEAARQALHALVPGVVFDSNGTLVELPNLDFDLLGISNKKRETRTWDVYPSTTSEEDNDYYASRGASVCSTLLHAMWQINDNIPEPPSYTYKVCADAKQKIGASTGVAIHRSSFSCTARLLLRTPVAKGAEKSKSDAESSTNREAPDEKDKLELGIKTLVVAGTAVTKREARHVASAKLLAMLFPECNGMAEVKAAAEAAREQYTASKANRRNDRGSDQVTKFSRKRSMDSLLRDPSDLPLPKHLSLCLRELLGRDEADTTVDDGHDEVSVESLSLSEKATLNEKVSKSDRGEITCNETSVKESVARSLNRKAQLDERVDSALQVLNELDEEGRALPEELNINHVGRTVLRRAESEDVDWIQKLLAHQDERSARIFRRRDHAHGPLSLLGVSDARKETEVTSCAEQSSRPIRLWGSSAITLLLCRAIAPKEDPPLGCAVVTLDFSMKKGPTLRIAELVSEPHLPNERFIEVLENFATHMKCALGNDFQCSSPSTAETTVSTEQLKAILASHLGQIKQPEKSLKPVEQATGRSYTVQDGILDLKTIGASLQSVQEEVAEADEIEEKESEDKDDRRVTKQDKPSKRSRVV